MAYYNDNDAFCAGWLRNLIAVGHLPLGTVDERSILDIAPEDCAKTSHFFAGIGGWPLALRMAGWPDDEPVWTGSCPCQPFSVAGTRKGEEDERHLWPGFRDLIAACKPPVVFGEQVASSLGRAWLAGVRADLEALGYRVGAADLCAAGVGAPHIRQRLFWVADATDGRADRGHGEAHGEGQAARFRSRADIEDGRPTDRLANAEGGRCEQCDSGERAVSVADKDGGLGNAPGEGREGQPHAILGTAGWEGEYLLCADGKARRIEPGIQPLAHGVPSRVGRLRAYGNAIIPQVAAAFIRAYMGVG